MTTMQTMQIEVKGMTCGHCERAVEEGLSAVPGVDHARADRETGRVTLHLVQGATIPEDTLREVLDDEGYVFGGVVA